MRQTFRYGLFKYQCVYASTVNIIIAVALSQLNDIYDISGGNFTQSAA